MPPRKPKATRPLSATPSDPAAPLDSAALLGAAIPLLKKLAADLLARADGSPSITAALQRRHAADQQAELTADDYDTWRRAFTEQVAAAWFLSCVFVRTLEDRGLAPHRRLAGPGAEDSQRAFFALSPSLCERDYLLTVFRELEHQPATAPLFDARHNPVWLLGPSAALCQELLAFFRAPHAEAPAFRFGGTDTRFLGDLYQDLSENVRKRYALLQTPRFVEAFILDQTLDRAIERFGLSETTLIDPTCGSGHFLLGAFDRLFERRLAEAPGTDPRQAALAALAAVAGADINPYAVAIARFRLTLAFLEKAGYDRLKGAPKLPLNLAVADSLLHNPHVPQGELGDLPTTTAAAWKGPEFRLDDPTAARAVLYQQYTAVVGNPPYITVKDAKLRERYRAIYSRSAAGKYSVAAPFCERFFQLGRTGAFVGMITANSFMKREFGKKLIEEYLPTINLETIINTSGAYIPGHGTPTVLLFGTADKPQSGKVHTVLASRGEPSTPEDPEKGEVWSSIANHWNEVGFENDYISVTETDRDALAKHPWSLGGGGATELKELLEERAEKRLGEVVAAIGVMAVTGEDDVYVHPSAASLRRNGVSDDDVRPFGIGENIRDWGAEYIAAVYPHDDAGAFRLPASAERYLWPFRTTLGNYVFFGKVKAERGLDWRAYGAVQKDKLRRPESITFAFVATHNHFVLDHGGKVFKQSAPIIKLPEGATEDEHYALLAYLNSSTACFWMKQEFYPKGSAVRDAMTPENNRYEFAGTGLQRIPLPTSWRDGRLAQLGREAETLSASKARLDPNALLRDESAWSDDSSLATALAGAKVEERRLLSRLVFLQEEIDWLV